MQAAKAAGAVTSFDLNYRAEALEHLRAASNAPSRCSTASSKNVDVLVGNEEDLQKGLGIPGPEVAAKSKLDPSAFFGMMDNVREEASRTSRSSPPRCAKSIPPTATAGARSPGSTARPTSRPTRELDVFDRVGGGDGYAAGFFYGLLTGETSREGRQPRLGARRAAHHLPRRHHHGHARPGPRLRQRRLRPHPALTNSSIAP